VAYVEKNGNWKIVEEIVYGGRKRRERKRKRGGERRECVFFSCLRHR